MFVTMWRYITRGIVVSTVAVVAGFLTGLVLKSFVDAWKSLGPLLFLSMCGFMGVLIYVYGEGDWVRSIYCLAAVLLLHIIVWGSGYYRAR